MKAPDKICIRKDDTAPFGFTPHWIVTTKVQDQDIVYIRKEVLLELLKPEHDVAFCEDYERGCIDGRNALREELINKLNSL